MWLTDLVTLGMATHEDTWEEVASGLEESSTLEGVEPPRAADAGLFRVGLHEACLKVSSATCERNSWTSLVMLMWPPTPEGFSMVRWVEEVGAKVS